MQFGPVPSLSWWVGSLTHMNLKSQLELLFNILNRQFKFYKQDKYIFGSHYKDFLFHCNGKKGYSKACGYHKIVSVLDVMDSEYSNSWRPLSYSKSFIP